MSTLATLTRPATRDNKATHLPNASTLGFGLYRAKRGNWVQFADGSGAVLCGRVLGGVTANGVADRARYVEVIALLGCLDNPAIRWVRPEDIQRCEANPPARIFAFICGDWTNPDTVASRVADGFARTAGTLAYTPFA